MWLGPRQTCASFCALEREVRDELALALKTVLRKYDRLFDRPMPYVLAWYQAPVRGRAYPECQLHAEILPAYRTGDKLKYLAGTEWPRACSRTTCCRRKRRPDWRPSWSEAMEAGFQELFGRAPESRRGHRDASTCSASIRITTKDSSCRPRFRCARAWKWRRPEGIDSASIRRTWARRPPGLRRGRAGRVRPLRIWLCPRARALRHRRSPVAMRIESTVPIGRGLSSSASLEVAVLRALRALLRLSLDDVRIALLARQAEVEFTGVRCGILDQMAVSLCEPRQMLFLDTRTLDRRTLDMPPDSEMLVLDSGVPRRLESSAYNRRREECEHAARRLGVISLRDVVDTARSAGLPPPLDRRARHVFTENERVIRAAGGVGAAEFGRLMSKSHESLRDDFEVSTPGLDSLVALLQGHPQAYGARLTGAGFGVRAWHS